MEEAPQHTHDVLERLCLSAALVTWTCLSGRKRMGRWMDLEDNHYDLMEVLIKVSTISFLVNNQVGKSPISAEQKSSAETRKEKSAENFTILFWIHVLGFNGNLKCMYLIQCQSM